MPADAPPVPRLFRAQGFRGRALSPHAVFRKVLIANRGEIAIRVARTCREMGIRTVGVYSDADRDALHRRAMDETIHIGPAPPAFSYLNIDAILDVARRTQAEAIHPGYGFLAENPQFVRRVEEAGFVFIGPASKAMALSGDKIASRRAMRRAGLETTPGKEDPVENAFHAKKVARTIGYPVMLKAKAGGGGIGMTMVRSASEMEGAFVKARATVLAAFGDGTLFLEKYLRNARHVEVQVLAGSRGRAVHLGERECSIQRRNQKLIEESPSPIVDTRTRTRIGALAVKGLRAIGYRNAGTVEFLYYRGRFHFNEVNARLQVEHPVTELVTGLDLVRRQLSIAWDGDPGMSQSEFARRGHAIECRINAEDPLRNFLPTPGTVVTYREPSGPGIRVDSGIAAGSGVPPEYDPLVAKVVVLSEDRGGALARMERALREYAIGGVSTTIPFHLAMLADAEFRKGNVSTSMVERRRILDRVRELYAPSARIAAIAAVVARFGPERFLRVPGLTFPRPAGWALAGRPGQEVNVAVPTRRRW